MRCPKCGYISFDNLDSCLKCNKDISDLTQAFKGSTLKVETPSFLKFSVSEEGDQQIEGAAEVGGDIEFSDPDLEILVDDEDDQGEIDFSLEDDEDVDETLSFSDDLDEPTAIDEAEEDIDLAADLGQFEDVPEEETFSFSDEADDENVETSDDADFPAMEIPDELDDISDLSPPEESSVEEAVVEAVAEANEEESAEAPLEAALEQEGITEQLADPEPEDDLDFSNLDFDLGSVDEVVEEPEVAPQEETVAAVAEEEEPMPATSSMDEDLDFDLDLGGLKLSSTKK